MKRNRGFLLFEVMVAVTLVGIALATILQSISYALAAGRASKDYFGASSVLSQKLWETTAAQDSIQAGVREGVCTENPKYHYRIAVEELFPEKSTETQGAPKAQNLSKPRSLAKVTVTVSWNHRGTVKTLSAHTSMPLEEEENILTPITTFR